MFPSHLISGFPFVSILLFGGLAMFQHIWTYEKHPGYDVRPVSVVHLHQLPASRSGRSFWRPSPHSQAAERSPAALSDSMVHRRRRGCRGRRSREASQAFRGDGGGWVGNWWTQEVFTWTWEAGAFKRFIWERALFKATRSHRTSPGGRKGSSRSCQKS